MFTPDVSDVTTGTNYDISTQSSFFTVVTAEVAAPSSKRMPTTSPGPTTSTPLPPPSLAPAAGAGESSRRLAPQSEKGSGTLPGGPRPQGVHPAPHPHPHGNNFDTMRKGSPLPPHDSVPPQQNNHRHPPSSHYHYGGQMANASFSDEIRHLLESPSIPQPAQHDSAAAAAPPPPPPQPPHRANVVGGGESVKSADGPPHDGDGMPPRKWSASKKNEAAVAPLSPEEVLEEDVSEVAATRERVRGLPRLLSRPAAGGSVVVLPYGASSSLSSMRRATQNVAPSPVSAAVQIRSSVCAAQKAVVDGSLNRAAASRSANQAGPLPPRTTATISSNNLAGLQSAGGGMRSSSFTAAGGAFIPKLHSGHPSFLEATPSPIVGSQRQLKSPRRQGGRSLTPHSTGGGQQGGGGGGAGSGSSSGPAAPTAVTPDEFLRITEEGRDPTAQYCTQCNAVIPLRPYVARPSLTVAAATAATTSTADDATTVVSGTAAGLNHYTCSVVHEDGLLVTDGERSLVVKLNLFGKSLRHL